MPEESTDKTTTDKAATEAAPAEETSPKKEEPKLDEDLKKDLKKAKSSVWKKVLIWGGGILAIIGALIGILYLLKGKGPISGVKEAVQKSKNEVSKADMDEKIKVAKAKEAEEAVVKKLEEIKEIDDEVKRLEELNKLL